MQMFTEDHNQTEFRFNDPASFTPEYLPEVITPFYLNKSVITTYSKKGKWAKFFALPKLATYILDTLEKSNEYSHDLHSLVKKTQSAVGEGKGRLDQINDRFSALEGRVHMMSGEFDHKVQPLIDKINNSEATVEDKIRRMTESGNLPLRNELKDVKKQLADLKVKDRLLWVVLMLSMGLNGAAIYYFAILGKTLP